MGAEENIQTVKDIYAAFDRGDINAILDRLAEDVVWDHNSTARHAVPFYTTCRGRDAVRRTFFGPIAEATEVTRFERHDFVGSGDVVVVRYSYDGVAKRTGRSYASVRGVHWWTFAPDGKVVSYQGLDDTAPVVEAWRG